MSEQPKEKYRDFSEMPDDVLRAFAYDLAHPTKAVKRIKAARKAKHTSC